MVLSNEIMTKRWGIFPQGWGGITLIGRGIDEGGADFNGPVFDIPECRVLAK